MMSQKNTVRALEDCSKEETAAHLYLLDLVIGSRTDVGTAARIVGDIIDGKVPNIVFKPTT